MKQAATALIIFAMTIFWGASVYAEEPTTALSAQQQKYHAKWAELVASLEQRSDLSFTQKLAEYDKAVAALKQQYVDDRVSGLQQREQTLTVTHSCKGRPSGSTKNCGYRCVERPNNDMYTTEEWITFSGDTMGEITNEEKACFKLEAKGNVYREGSVTAVFKYRDSFIGYKTMDDADALFRSFFQQ